MISRSPEILKKFFRNKDFIEKLKSIKETSKSTNPTHPTELHEERSVSPRFLSIRKSGYSNETLKNVNSCIEEAKKDYTLSHKTPSFKFDNSKNSMNNTVSNINPPEIFHHHNESKALEEKDIANEVFNKLNNESFKDENTQFSPPPLLKKLMSNQIFYYGTIAKKNSYGTEFTKLSSSIQTGSNQSWYDSRTSSHNTLVYSQKAHTINEKKSHKM